MSIPLTLITFSGIAMALLAFVGTPRGQREATLIARQLALPPNATVADVGAGSGKLTVELARRLGPSGQIFATEIEPDKVAAIARRARRSGLDNVRALQATADRSGLPPACCDGALMRGVYHHLTAPDATLDDLFAALRPGGRLLVIDFRPTFWLKPWMPKGLPPDRTGHGIDPETVEAEARAAGFVVEQRLEDWPSPVLHRFYALVLRRPPANGQR
ncbi:MAG TPA: methyltransferase domain-containing protein [Pseudomonadales bacterium]